MSRWLRRLLLLLALAVTWSCLFQEWYATSSQWTSPSSRILMAVLQENDQIDMHSSQMALLPLQPWELVSLRGLHQAGLANTTTTFHKQQVTRDSCQPPPGIPAACCLGTFAGMGRIVTNRRHTCAPAATALDKLVTTVAAVINNNNSRGCDVCALVEHLRQTNQSMSFVGDSMSHQIFQGLLCEFYRRHYTVQEFTESMMILPGRHQRRRRREASPCPSNRNHCLHLVRSVHVSSPTWEKINAVPVTFQFFHIYRLPFADPHQERRVLESASIWVVNFGLHWGAHYYGRTTSTHPNHNDTTTNNMASPSEDRREWLTGPDHPPTPRHLETVLTAWLQKAAAFRHHHPNRNNQPRQILIRETSAQHFDAVGGDYSYVKQRYKDAAVQGSGQVKRNLLQCVPFHKEHPHGTTKGTSNNATTSTSTLFTSGWREQVIRNAAHKANYSIRELPLVAATVPVEATTTTAMTPHKPPPPNPSFTSHPAPPMVTILPFAEWTRPLHDLHPYDDDDDDDKGGGGDCTHYCSSPLLYMPLWRSIREGIH